MDVEKDSNREAFEKLPLAELAIESEYVYYNEETNSYWPNEDFCPSDAPETMNFAWKAWQAAKAQAVLEKDQQVWATSNLTWKDIAFRALSCKVLKSTENWVHVKNIACVGSTTASLICKKLGVDPDGTKFELIEAQEPAND